MEIRNSFTDRVVQVAVPPWVGFPRRGHGKVRFRRHGSAGRRSEHRGEDPVSQRADHGDHQRAAQGPAEVVDFEVFDHRGGHF